MSSADVLAGFFLYYPVQFIKLTMGKLLIQYLCKIYFLTKRLFLLALLLFGVLDSLSAQSPEVDILTFLQKTTNDARLRVDYLNERAFFLIYDDPGRATKDVMEALDQVQALSYQEGIARSNNILGGIHWALGECDRAMEAYIPRLRITKFCKTP